ncbi:MAG: PorT family protein [Bacteroidales bacterium]|nr:PorT family protein [Bacteroidales bacterium]
MKNIVITISLILIMNISSFSIFAQETNSGGGLVSNMIIGAKAGMTYSYFIENYKNIFTGSFKGYTGGVYANYYLKDNIAVGAEINFIEYGATNIKPSIIYGDNDNFYKDFDRTNVRIYRLDIPVYGIYHIPGFSGDLQPRIIAGPSFGYNLQTMAINESNIGATDIKTVSKFDVTERFKSWEYTATAGIGVNLKISSLIFSVDARYRAGLYNINNRDNSENFTTGTFILMIGVGL